MRLDRAPGGAAAGAARRAGHRSRARSTSSRHGAFGPTTPSRWAGRRSSSTGAQVVSSLDDGTRADLEVVGAGRATAPLDPRGGRPPRGTRWSRRRGCRARAHVVLPSKRGRFPSRGDAGFRPRAGHAGLQPGDAPSGSSGRTSSSVPSTPDRPERPRCGGAIRIPGADLPVVDRARASASCSRSAPATASSSRRIAPSRSSGVLGAGLGMRTVARELLDFIPVAGGAVRGGVAYGGTRARGSRPTSTSRAVPPPI